jgi:uncharacterized protein with von Willebrand factor type A (vWA) domain
MFIDFFYELKGEGIPVCLNEWMTLMEALAKDLAFSSLTGFYYLARAVLVKNEAHLDSFDLAFAKYFKGVETPELIIQQALELLKNIEIQTITPSMHHTPFSKDHIVELQKILANKLKDQQLSIKQNGSQNESTQGSSPFGSSGAQPTGFRIGGESKNLSALQVAADRNYKELRNDMITGVRQFEMALRKLRQLSSRVEGPKDEFDLDATIDATSNNAGMLTLIWDRPRRNTLKIILLMDSVGSMDRHIDTCSRLFTAANRTTHFKEIKFYYFHNCVYDHIYKSHILSDNNRILTEEFFRTMNSDYRLIIVGDASMSESELTMPGGAIAMNEFNKEPGLLWLKRLARHFPYSVWLNPVPATKWGEELGHTSIPLIQNIFPMFELNPAGLEQAIKRIRSKIV